jgi:hypothetical protein
MTGPALGHPCCTRTRPSRLPKPVCRRRPPLCKKFLRPVSSVQSWAPGRSLASHCVACPASSVQSWALGRSLAILPLHASILFAARAASRVQSEAKPILDRAEFRGHRAAVWPALQEVAVCIQRRRWEAERVAVCIQRERWGPQEVAICTKRSLVTPENRSTVIRLTEYH